jgi:hypothetical protein
VVPARRAALNFREGPAKEDRSERRNTRRASRPEVCLRPRLSAKGAL